MLYFIKSGDYIKIGYAKDVESRMKDYYCTNPNFLLLDVIEGDLKMELFLHKILAPYRYRTEWYNNVREVYNIWNDYKQTVIDIKHIPTVLSIDDYKVLDTISKFAYKQDNKILIDLSKDQLSKIRKRINLKWDFIRNIIRNLQNRRWIIPYDKYIRELNVDLINEHLKNDSIIFDKENMQFYINRLEYMDS